MKGRNRGSVTLIRQHKITSTFICFLLLAGVCNMLTKVQSTFVATLMFCLNFMIYIGLIIFWVQHVIKRILPTKTRGYIIASSFFMILYILQRVVRYRLLINSVIAYRYLGYFYFIPLIMMPSLLLVTAIHLKYGDNKISNNIEKVVIILAVAVSLIALTNDLHRLVYVPKVDMSVFKMDDNTYSWGIGFYVIYGWIIQALLLGAVFLLQVVGKKGKRSIILLASSVAVWLLLSFVHSAVFERFSIPRPYFKPEIDCFGMLLIFECCIRSRLIPHNENYPGFFKKLKLPILITDAELGNVNETIVPVNATKEDLIKAKNAPSYLDEDTRLSSMKIRAGYAFWTENEHELREQRQRLANANGLLSEENDLIAVENRLKEQKAHLDAQNQVYERITAAIYPKQKKIDELLSKTDPSSESFAETLGTVCVLNAYSKRKTNLLLLSEDTLAKSNRELFLALAESCRFLNSCNIHAAVVGEEYSKLPLALVNDLYDTFETVLETYLKSMKRMTVSILENGIRIAMEAGEKQELPNSALPVSCKESDGILYFTVSVPEGGAA